MEIIGYDDNWALVCPKYSAIIQYRPNDIKIEDIKDKQTGGIWHVPGLHCPNCSHFVSGKKCRRRIIDKAYLYNAGYYFAAADDKVIIV